MGRLPGFFAGAWRGREMGLAGTAVRSCQMLRRVCKKIRHPRARRANVVLTAAGKYGILNYIYTHLKE